MFSPVANFGNQSLLNKFSQEKLLWDAGKIESFLNFFNPIGYYNSNRGHFCQNLNGNFLMKIAFYQYFRENKLLAHLRLNCFSVTLFVAFLDTIILLTVFCLTVAYYWAQSFHGIFFPCFVLRLAGYHEKMTRSNMICANLQTTFWHLDEKNRSGFTGA